MMSHPMEMLLCMLLFIYLILCTNLAVQAQGQQHEKEQNSPQR